MITKVKTIWGSGLVSVADKYVDKAIRLKEPLEIECKGAVMVVPLDKLKEKKPRSISYRDKFGRNQIYSLYDFFWEIK